MKDVEAGNRRKEDSGLIDLDALMRQANASPTVEESGERPVLKAPVKATLIAPPKSEPPPPKKASPPPTTTESTPAVVAAIPPSPRVPEIAASVLATASTKERASSLPARRSWSRPLVGAAVAVALFGAGFYGWSRGRATIALAPVSVEIPREPATSPARPLETPAANDATQPSGPMANDLPSVASAMPSASAASVAASGAAKHGAQPAKAADAVVTTTELIPESPARSGDLGRAMHDAVGSDGSTRVAKTDATKENGARTVRPSPGAVIGALNAVLPSARECLGPDDAVRVGTVTFRSDGVVAKVELNGQRDSDACIKSAVAKARVEPFADDSFTTRVTVRP